MILYVIFITEHFTINIIDVCTLGSYELHVAWKTVSTDGTTLCKNFSFSELKQYRAAIECIRTMQGDTIVLKKTNGGALRLFEIYPIGKYLQNAYVTCININIITIIIGHKK